MKTSKRICKNGSITLPKAIRVEAGLFPGNAVDIETAADGTVTIKPVTPCCHFCGSPEQLVTVENITICKKCAMKVFSEVDVTDE